MNKTFIQMGDNNNFDCQIFVVENIMYFCSGFDEVFLITLLPSEKFNWSDRLKLIIMTMINGKYI